MEMAGEEPYGLLTLRQLLDNRCNIDRGMTVDGHHGMILFDGDGVRGLQYQPSLPRGGSLLIHEAPDQLQAQPLTLVRQLDHFGGGYAYGRWARQETITLLEIRSRLDTRFKEQVHKAPLWEEVSRIMADEHGYERSAKKCKEKMENLYKYYKKTKEGRVGRHDGKNYRFFKQLEAIYGKKGDIVIAQANVKAPNNPTFYVISEPLQNHSDNGSRFAHKQGNNLSSQKFSSFYGNSTEPCGIGISRDVDTHDQRKKNVRNDHKKRSWKSDITGFLNLQMKKFLDVQEAWLERILNTLDRKEEEMLNREEELRKQEATWLDNEQKRLSNEKAWIEVREGIVLEALRRLTHGERDEMNSITSENMTSMDVSDESP